MLSEKAFGRILELEADKNTIIIEHNKRLEQIKKLQILSIESMLFAQCGINAAFVDTASHVLEITGKATDAKHPSHVEMVDTLIREALETFNTGMGCAQAQSIYDRRYVIAHEGHRDSKPMRVQRRNRLYSEQVRPEFVLFSIGLSLEHRMMWSNTPQHCEAVNHYLLNVRKIEECRDRAAIGYELLKSIGQISA